MRSVLFRMNVIVKKENKNGFKKKIAGWHSGF